MEIFCPYCRNKAELVDSKIIYGKSYGMMWLCTPCDAYVGVHKNSKTFRPLGRLANAELRSWKKAAHKVFDPLWKSGKMKRKEAYNYLQKIMNMTAGQAHIGNFTVDECKKLVELLSKE